MNPIPKLPNYEQEYALYKQRYSLRATPPLLAMDKHSLFKKVSIFMVMIASGIVSSSHTLPTFYETLGDLPVSVKVMVSISAFVMIEFMIMIGVEVMLEFLYDRSESFRSQITTIVKVSGIISIVFAFVVAQLANLFSTYKGFGIDWYQSIKLPVAIITATSAPTLALVSGVMLAAINLSDKDEQLKRKADYDSAMAEWLKNLSNAFTAHWNKVLQDASKSYTYQMQLSQLDASPQVAQLMPQVATSSQVVQVANSTVETSENLTQLVKQLKRKADNVRDDNGNISAKVCPGCGKHLSESGFSRHECDELYALANQQSDAISNVTE